MSTQLVPFSGTASYTGATRYLTVIDKFTSATEAECQIPMPLVSGCSLSKVTLTVPFGPGGSDTATLTFRVNGSDSANAITITGASTTGTDSTAVALSAGDLMNFSWTSSLNPYIPVVQICCEFTPTVANEFMVLGHSQQDTTTQYHPLMGTKGDCFGATEATATQDMPVPGRFTSLYVSQDNAPGVGESVAYTLRVGAADSVLTGTIADAATTANYTTTYKHVTYLAAVAMKTVRSTAPTPGLFGFGLAFVPDVPEQCPYMYCSPTIVSGTGYAAIGSATLNSTSALVPPLRLSGAFTTRNMFVRMANGPGSGKTIVYNLQDDGVDSITELTFTGTDTSDDTTYYDHATLSPSGSLNSSFAAGSELRLVAGTSDAITDTSQTLKVSWTVAPAVPALVITSASYSGVAPSALQGINVNAFSGSTFPSACPSELLEFRWWVTNTAGSPVLNKDYSFQHPTYTSKTIQPWKNDWSASPWGIAGMVFGAQINDVDGTDTIHCACYDPMSGWSNEATFTVGNQGGEDIEFFKIADASPAFTYFRIGSGLSAGTGSGTSASPFLYNDIRSAVVSANYTGTSANVMFWLDFEEIPLAASATAFTASKNNTIFMRTPTSVESAKTGPLVIDYANSTSGGGSVAIPFTLSGVHVARIGTPTEPMYSKNDQVEAGASAGLRTAIGLACDGYFEAYCPVIGGGRYSIASAAAATGSGPYQVDLTISVVASRHSAHQSDFDIGETFTISGSTNASYNGTWTVVGSSGNLNITVEMPSDPGAYTGGGTGRFTTFHSAHSVTGIRDGCLVIGRKQKTGYDDMAPPLVRDGLWIGETDTGMSYTENIHRYIGAAGQTQRSTFLYCRWVQNYTTGLMESPGPKDPVRHNRVKDAAVICCYADAGRFEIGEQGNAGVSEDAQNIRFDRVHTANPGGHSTTTSHPRYEPRQRADGVFIGGCVCEVPGSSNEHWIVFTHAVEPTADAINIRTGNNTILHNHTNSSPLVRIQLTSLGKGVMEEMVSNLFAVHATPHSGFRYHNMASDTQGSDILEWRGNLFRNHSGATNVADRPGSYGTSPITKTNWPNEVSRPRVIDQHFENIDPTTLNTGNEFVPVTTLAVAGEVPHYGQRYDFNGNVIPELNAYIGAVNGAFVDQVLEDAPPTPPASTGGGSGGGGSGGYINHWM